MRDDFEDSAGYSDWVTDLAFFGMAFVSCAGLAAIVLALLP